MGFTYRKYQVNENFFKQWSAEMSYVLGLICADGSVQDSTKHKGPVLRIASKEKEPLEELRDLMSSTHLVREESNKNGQWFVLSIYSKRIVHDLMSIGIKPRKSWDGTMPDIPDEYMPDFIRGFFDGDGSVYEVKTPNSNMPGIETDFSIHSKIFREQLTDYLNAKLATQHGKFKVQISKAGAGRIRASNKCSEALYYYMYNGGPCLQRKYNKFTNLIQKRESHKPQ